MSLAALAWEQVKQGHLLMRDTYGTRRKYLWYACWAHACNAARDYRDMVSGLWWVG